MSRAEIRDVDDALPMAPPSGLAKLAPGRSVMVALAYLLAISVAETATAAGSPRLGLPIHGLILLALLVHGAVAEDLARRALLWGLSLAPLIRILSLSLPLAGLPVLYWYAIISVPVFAATIATIRVLGYSWRDVGLTVQPHHWLLESSMLPLGIALGLIEYFILTPQPLARSLAPAEVWLPILVLTISTGFEEELIFRGLLQRAALQTLGPLKGLLYVSAVFTSLHIGYLSWVDLVFVFIVGSSFALVALRTGSILGVTLGHSGVNVGLFILWPFLLPLLVGRG